MLDKITDELLIAQNNYLNTHLRNLLEQAKGKEVHETMQRQEQYTLHHFIRLYCHKNSLDSSLWKHYERNLEPSFVFLKDGKISKIGTEQ